MPLNVFLFFLLSFFVSFSLPSSFTSLEMENASEAGLFVSKISKESDYILASIYTFFGMYHSPALSRCSLHSKRGKENSSLTICLFPPFPVSTTTQPQLHPTPYSRCHVPDGEQHPAVCGLPQEVFSEASRVLCCQSVLQ